MNDWRNIHEGFGERDGWGKTYQQKWEGLGITYQEAQEWIKWGFKPRNCNWVREWKKQSFNPPQVAEWISLGFEPQDYDEVKKWGKKDFGYNQIQEWIELGLQPKDYEFALWLRDEENKIPEQLSKKDIEFKREKYNWQDNRKDLNLYMQQKWTNRDFDDFDIVGLKHSDYEFAIYLEWKCYHPNQMNQILNLEWLKIKRLRKEFSAWQKSPLAQAYLDCFFPQEKRVELTELNVYNKNLTGELNCSNFGNLEYLYCGDNKLTSLSVSNLTNLKEILCSDNQLTSLGISDLENLEVLYCSHNCLTDINSLLSGLNPEEIKELNLGNNNFSSDLTPFTRFVNLKTLRINNNHFSGSLKSLANLRKLKSLNISDTDIDSGLECLPESLENIFLQRIKLEKEEIKEWKQHKFTTSQILEWIKAGLKYKDADYCAWLRDKRGVDAEWALNNVDENKKLKEKYDEKYKLYNWTSGNREIDIFIQGKQLEATDTDKCLKWISYEQFSNVEYLAEGGFGKVYKAKWNNGIYPEMVALKILSNSQNVTADFLQEVTYHKLVDNLDGIVKCYGISQDSHTKNYIMVMEYIKGSNLRQYLQNNYCKLDFYKKLSWLMDITKGLKSIHERGLIHKDFHPGNILSGVDFYEGFVINCWITDLGLSQPANQKSFREKVYGSLPYVAPEVLYEKQYTQAADIYSLGIVAYELFSGSPPYCNVPHNISLTIKICQGLRPNLGNTNLPPSLEGLISMCWDADPLLRPSASDLCEILGNWLRYDIYDKSSAFHQQYKKIRDMEKKIRDMEKPEWFFRELPSTSNNNITTFLDYKTQTHSQVIFHSRLLDSNNLPKPRNNEEINEQFWNSEQAADSDLINLQIPSINLNQPNLSENEVSSSQEPQLQAQIQISPKQD